MIRVYSNATGVLAETGWTAGTALGPDAVWIDLINPTGGEEVAVEAALGIDIPVREKLAEIEASSRLYVRGSAAFMTATLIVRADKDKPEIEAVTFVLAGERLVTVRYCEPRAFDIYAARAGRDASQCPPTGEAVLIGLLEAVVDRLADHLERVGSIVTSTSAEVFRREFARRRDFYALITRIGEEGDFTSNVRESLVTLGRVAAFIPAVAPPVEKGRKAPQAKVIQSHLKTLQRDIHSLTDHASFLSDKISFLLDATLGMITIEQNNIIKAFTVGAGIFLPPVLIASIYGMNFQFMPELQWAYGYPLALGLMVLSAVLPFVYFRYKGWV
jgi:magnesium transporter